MNRLRQKWEKAQLPLPPKIKRRKKRRPRKRKRLPFAETPVGKYLRNMTPLEYRFLTEHLPPMLMPNPDTIEQLGYSSGNPAFRLPYFRRLLMDYRTNGGYTKKTLKDLSAGEMLKFIKLKKEG